MKPLLGKVNIFEPIVPLLVPAPELRTLIKKEPDIYSKKDILTPAQYSDRITSLIQSRKCTNCHDAVGCNEPCDEFTKLCAYEQMKDQQRKP